MLDLVHTTPLGLATHARAPHTCRPTHQVPKTPSPAGHFQARGEETTRSIDLVLHTVDTRSSRCSDENMTTGLQSGVGFPSSKAKRLSPPHIAFSRRAEAHIGIVRWVSLLSSFIFLLLFSSSKKWHVPRHLFSLFLTQLKQRQTTGPFISTKHTARFFLSPKPEGQ